MPSRWTTSLAKYITRAPRVPGDTFTSCGLTWLRALPRVEQLESRTTPSVTAFQGANGALTVTFSAANDSGTIEGTAASGTSINVTDNGTSTTQTFTGVTAITVLDSAPAAGQVLTFDDAGTGTDIDLTGAISVSGIETVNVATADGPLVAESFTVAGATTAINLQADVTTTGTTGQSYGGPVAIGSGTVTGVTLDAGTSGGVTFSQSVNSSTGNSNALTVEGGGANVFTGAVGGTTALASLTVDAGGSTSLGANITTTGVQSYGDAVTLDATNVQIISTNSGNISFGSTLDGTTSAANSLTVQTSGATAFAGTVGKAVPLGTLMTGSQGTTNLGSNVTTTASQSYNNPVTISGGSITLTSNSSGSILFDSTVDGETSGANALTVSTAGGTTFSDSVGGSVPLASVTTEAAGSAVIGNGSGTVSINTSGAQDFSGAVTVDAHAASTITFASSGNGDITFGSTLNAETAGTNGIAVNTGGVTTFAGKVGATAAPTTLTTDNEGHTGEQTVIQNTVTTSSDLKFQDAVVITPATSVTLVSVTSTAGMVTFGSTITESSNVPLSVVASDDVAIDGNVTLSGSGSQLTVHAGTSGTGEVSISTGVTVDADTQIWQAGDGTGGNGTSSTVNLVANSPTFLAASGSGAPQAFVLRQDAAVTDSTIPTLAQFGGSTPANLTIISDDAGVTLTMATVADSGTISLTLSAEQGLSIGEAIDAPLAVVRLQSITGSVTETASAGITALALGVNASTGIDLSTGGTGKGNTINGTFAATTASGNIQLSSAGAVIVGAIAADAAPGIFTAVTGVTATTGSVAFTQPGTTPLNLTIDAPVEVKAGDTVTATGTTNSDQVTVNYTVGASLPQGLTFDGGGSDDSLTLSDANGTSAHTYTIAGTVTRDSDKPITYTNVGKVSITGGTAADTFNVTPDANTAYTLNGGGAPAGSTPGDALAFTFTGATSPDLTEKSVTGGLSGSASFGNFQTVMFNQMTTVTPEADIQVTATSATSTVAAGGTVTVTVVVTNAGSITADDVPVSVPVPAGATLSWNAMTSSGSSLAATSGTGAINTTATLAASGTATFTITETFAQTTTGTVNTVATVGAATNAFDPNSANNTATASTSVIALDLIAVGAGAGGGPQVKVYNQDGSLRLNFYAYDTSYHGGVTVATGDITGDGVPDIVTGSAEGSSNVKVFDGTTGAQIASFFAFPGFTGGVNVAVVDNEVVVGAGPGGGPIVAGFTIANGVATQAFSFFAFDSSFRGGSTVGGAGTNLAVGAGVGGGPNVKVFDFPSLTQVSSFYAFPVGSVDGVSVAVGTTGGQPSVVVGAGPGSTPVVNTFVISTTALANSVLAYDQGFSGGVQVATGDTATGEATTIYGTGPGGAPRVRVVAEDGTTLLDFYAFDPSFTGGVYVG